MPLIIYPRYEQLYLMLIALHYLGMPCHYLFYEKLPQHLYLYILLEV